LTFISVLFSKDTTLQEADLFASSDDTLEDTYQLFPTNSDGFVPWITDVS
jgi:hypothetical protein